ncbi:MAG: polymerase subunit gamma/tau [Panacagrimonas sp.]|jgi:DNA polymerase-3 subunit gamma/tau|nr:DNA polymerase III subunit gamma/tau [Panacagrimonas sp.]MCC2657655.1 polymerase subunit gamma/tau [Panacagrimonas sp.]
MSYLALARKWRPRVFADVMGQGHVVKALSHALDGDKLHPAILLTGTRGVGKTTLARIVAKGLNCETGVSANPCGVCTSCREVDTGRFVDLLEIDAASNTGVDNVRELIDNSQYAPARGRYKVYLIDEVHMLSKSAFNALLKTLEEPPPHVKFILATTDPQKLPITVLSRCLQFNLKRLPVVVIREQLSKVLGQENVAFEAGAVGEIARAADGSMRDGLSLLDQAIAFSGGAKLERGPVEDMLGTSGRQVLYAVLGAIASGDGAALLRGIEQLETRAPDYSALLNDLAGYLQRLAVLQVLPAAQSEDDDAELLALVPRMSAEDVQLCYQIAVSGRRDLPWAPDPRSGFEMTLLRMLTFRPDEPGGTRSGTSTPSSAPPRKAPTPSTVEQSAPVTSAATAPPDAAPAPGIVAARIAPPAVPRLPPQDLPWSERIETLGIDGSARQLARQCAWLGESEGVIRLSLTASAGFLLHESRRSALEQALSQQAGAPRRVLIEVAQAEDNPTSPAQLDQQRARDRQRQAQAAIEQDPVVCAFKEQFGASVRPGSVQPN